ncbi:MAG TPA: purine-nucleoside phosphorylase [Ignavibacteria bacterium]|nr:purine-nucleoside phosphorylase [Ignavibacteria bacterium]HMR40583.1 purine-nucleoside phosphorylase [Ignavibacteria bacterium]
MTERHYEAVNFLNSKHSDKYPVGIILGTGLGGLVKDIRIKSEINYSEIPNFPVSTVESHSGKLIFGTLSGKKIVAMQGRFHYYEGYTMDEVTFPVYIMKALGVKNLIVSNACGALNPRFSKTDLMIMSSHINLLFNSPLRNKKINFTDGSKIYSDRLIKLAEKTALDNGIPVQKGVYCPVQGPNLETVAEYRMIRKMGGDTVGMSTIPEAKIAHNLGIEVLGLSIITDEGFPDTLKVALLPHILEAAAVAEPKLTKLIRKLVGEIDN